MKNIQFCSFQENLPSVSILDFFYNTVYMKNDNLLDKFDKFTISDNYNLYVKWELFSKNEEKEFYYICQYSCYKYLRELYILYTKRNVLDIDKCNIGIYYIKKYEQEPLIYEKKFFYRFKDFLIKKRDLLIKNSKKINDLFEMDNYINSLYIGINENYEKTELDDYSIGYCKNLIFINSKKDIPFQKINISNNIINLDLSVIKSIKYIRYLNENTLFLVSKGTEKYFLKIIS